MVARAATAFAFVAALAAAGASHARLSLSVDHDFGVTGDAGPYSATVSVLSEGACYREHHLECPPGTATVQVRLDGTTGLDRRRRRDVPLTARGRGRRRAHMA